MSRRDKEGRTGADQREADEGRGALSYCEANGNCSLSLIRPRFAGPPSPRGRLGRGASFYPFESPRVSEGPRPLQFGKESRGNPSEGFPLDSSFFCKAFSFLDAQERKCLGTSWRPPPAINRRLPPRTAKTTPATARQSVKNLKPYKSTQTGPPLSPTGYRSAHHKASD